MTKFFTLLVESSINNSPVFEGTLNKETGQPDGDLVKVQLQLGKLTVSNYSRVWASIGVDKAGKPNGELTFLEWGAKGGEVVEIRYLPNSSSLSKQYQDLVQKIKPSDEDLELGLDVGINEFDYDTEYTLIDFWKHHSWNGDNKSRNPKIKTVMFTEYSGDVSVKNRVAKMKLQDEARNYVLNAVDDKTLIVLASIFGEEVKLDDSILVDLLLDRVESNYQNFLDVIADSKTNIFNALKDAEENKVLSGKSGGEITVRELSKDEPLLPGTILSEGQTAAEYLFENFLQEEVYDSIARVDRALLAFKKLQNN